MKKAVQVISLIFLFVTLLMLTACQERKADLSAQMGGGKVIVYTSFYPMYDFVKKIGGDKVEVTNMVPSGIEPHDWEPTPRDLANLSRAQVFFYNGGGMEGWVEKILSSLGNGKLVAVETSQGINYLPSDPHTWLNPQNAKEQMEKIKDTLGRIDPANKDYYEKNYLANAKKLEQLDQEYKNALSKCKKKEIVVAHQAFGYLCQAYGLKQIAIEGLSADSEPTPAKMAQIAKFAKEHQIKYIFFEELISPKVAQAIAKKIGAKTQMLNPLEGLSDQEQKQGKEYFSVMRDNLVKLKKALE